VTPHNFSEFLERRGHTVHKFDDMFVYDKFHSIFLSFPFDRSFDISNDDFNSIVNSTNCKILRYSAVNGDANSCRIRCCCKDYSLSSLSSRARSQTRRGLENVDIRSVSVLDLVYDGFKLRISTFDRQKRRKSKNMFEQWKKYCEAASSVEGFKAWGAYYENSLVSLLIGFQMDNCFHILIANSDEQHLRQYPNNAITYEVTRELMQNPSISEVSFGHRSLANTTAGLDEFKRRMGFEFLDICETVRVAPKYRPFVKSAGLIVGLTSNIFSKNDNIAKANVLLKMAQ